MRTRVQLTEQQASMVLSNWGHSHPRVTWLSELLPTRKCADLIAAWGNDVLTTSNFLASIIEVIP